MTHLGERLQHASTRRAEAEAGVQFETRRMGDRLVVIEPAALPERPIGDQKWFVGSGLLISVLAAIALAFLLDIRNPALATARQLRQNTDHPRRNTGIFCSPPRQLRTNIRRL